MIKSTMAAGLTVGLLAAVFATPSTADGPPEVFTAVSHEDETVIIPADPNCGEVGATEVQQGTERLHVVISDDDVHLVAGETVWIYTTLDDPSLPTPAPRHQTDAVVFHSINDERVVIFHESFRDRNTEFGDISVNETSVVVHGDIKVERFVGRNLPPDGC
jgi:hypothetical protein